ncbi:hypothetical protein BN1013_01627 [Candidatus Rubidus massiliensis]|nr:hypothetical protein BN1013_01627 [Candidatus Rubidus massiliensis]
MDNRTITPKSIYVDTETIFNSIKSPPTSEDRGILFDDKGNIKSIFCDLSICTRFEKTEIVKISKKTGLVAKTVFITPFYFYIKSNQKAQLKYKKFRKITRFEKTSLEVANFLYISNTNITLDENQLKLNLKTTAEHLFFDCFSKDSMYPTIAEKWLTDKKSYLINEFFGPSLFDSLNTLSLNQRLSICSQMIDLVAIAHAKQFSLGDIKPLNTLIKVLQDGSVKIKMIDFDFSKDHRIKLQTNNHFYGTPLYMPFEAIFNPKINFFQADIWSLGITIYELFTFDITILPFKNAPYMVCDYKHGIVQASAIIEKCKEDYKTGHTIQLYDREVELDNKTKYLYDQIEIMIHEMLTFDPTERWTIEKIKEFYQSLMNNYEKL